MSITALVLLPALTVAAQMPTWHDDVQPLIARRCVSCHQAGGSAPFALTSYEQALDRRFELADAVRGGRMPPWSPDENCRPTQNPRQLTDAEQTLFLEWAEGVALEGTPSTPEPPPAQIALTAPYLETSGGGMYVPKQASLDDYRCFLLEQTFDSQTWVTGYDIVPDQTALVHHAAVYLVPPAYLDQARANDAAEPDDIGWTCFGGPGLDFVEYFGGWVPGSGAVLFPPDSGYAIPEGSRVVLQVHYHVEDAQVAPDLTRVRFSTTDQAPTMRVRQRPFFNLDIQIPAGDAASLQTKLTPFEGATPWQGVGVLPHMHLLGERISLQIVRADGSRECLVDIPDWDFDWQETFFFAEPTEVGPGDQLELTCRYNNSAENQPWVLGEQITPRDVAWGEGSLDEMCVVVLTTLTPANAVPTDTCVGPGSEGNAIGVGKYCTDLDANCTGEADFCLATAVEDQTYCTKIYCTNDADCGEGARCLGNAAGSACIVDGCLDDDDDEPGCACDAAGESPADAAAGLLGLALVGLGSRRRQGPRSSR